MSPTEISPTKVTYFLEKVGIDAPDVLYGANDSIRNFILYFDMQPQITTNLRHCRFSHTKLTDTTPKNSNIIQLKYLELLNKKTDVRFMLH